MFFGFQKASVPPEWITSLERALVLFLSLVPPMAFHLKHEKPPREQKQEHTCGHNNNKRCLQGKDREEG